MSCPARIPQWISIPPSRVSLVISASRISSGRCQAGIPARSIPPGFSSASKITLE
jgi:hypothetical protein